MNDKSNRRPTPRLSPNIFSKRQSILSPTNAPRSGIFDLDRDDDDSIETTRVTKLAPQKIETPTEACLVQIYGPEIGKRYELDVPDFTEGGWRSAKPLGILDVDLSKLDFDSSNIKRDAAQLNV